MEPVLIGAGLENVEIGGRVDVFAGAPGEDSARQFGTHGVPLRAWKTKGRSFRVGL